MASTTEDVKLLFFDTFHHDQSNEELHLDLVEFSRPAVVYEVRVIPLKTQVEANLKKGYRLGGTFPSEFKLDVFVNNLNKPSASTFEKLGQLDYNENTNIQLKPDREVATDGLVLKGMYKTVTFAVYGWFTTINPDRASPPPPPPPAPGSLSSSKGKTNDLADDDAHKQQHPLDLFNEKLQQRQQGQLYSTPQHSSSSSSSTHKAPPALEDAFVDVLRKSPRRDRGLSKDRASRASSNDSRDGSRDSQERRKDLHFPPEPKEPFDLREKEIKREEERSKSREDRDMDSGMVRERISRRNSRESDVDIRPSSRSRGRDSHPSSRSRESSREPRELADRALDLDREKELERDKMEEREQERKEIESKEKREQEEKQRELKEKEREREPGEKSVKMRDQFDSERDRDKERDREKIRQRSDKDRERNYRGKDGEKDKDKCKDRDSVKKEQDGRGKERSESERRLRHGRSSRDRGRSRSGSPGSNSIKRSRQKRSRSWSRHRSKSVEGDRPPEPPIHAEVENAAGDEEVREVEEEAMEEQELYNTVSDDRPSSKRRRMAAAYDANSQEGEGYEDISSSDGEMGPVMEDPSRMQVLDMYELEEDTWGLTSFNPVEFYLTPLVALPNPSLSCYQLELVRAARQEVEGRPREAQTLLDLQAKFVGAEHQDKWVMALEEIPSLLDKGLSYLVVEEKRMDVVATLVEWVMEGVDANCAMTQPDAAIKVRHLKSGIKLAGRMCSTHPTIAKALLERGVQSKLLSLVESQFIVFSVKHLALRALSQTTQFAVGIQCLLGLHPIPKDCVVGDSGPRGTGYQRLVASLLKPKIVKLTMSITALLRKIHLYESLTNQYEVIERVIEKFSSLVEEQAVREGEEEEEVANPTLEEEDETKILAYLQEVIHILANPHNLIGQQANAVPYSLLVDNRVKVMDIHQAVFNIANACCLPESVLLLLSHPVLASKASVFLAVEDLIRQMMGSYQGLLYLASHTDTTNGIIRCLLQMEEQEESGEELPSRQLAIELVLHLQVLQHVDQLLELLRQDQPKQIDDPEVIVLLHGLHTLSFCLASRDPIKGRHIVANVLSMGHNIETLLAFLEKTGDEEHDNQMCKSISGCYATQLLLMTVQTLSSGRQLFENYGARLVSLCEDSPATSTKMVQLAEWVAPTKKVPTYDLDGLPAMIGQLKALADDLKKIPPGLITVLRMIHSLIELPNGGREDALHSNGLGEAKYRCVVVELTSADCFPIFMNILQKSSENQLKVWQQGIPFNSEQSLVFFSAIKPTLALVYACLKQLIESFSADPMVIAGKQSEGGEGEADAEEQEEDIVLNPCRDLTAVPILLELHTVMCSVPTSSLYNSQLAEIQRYVVDTLLAFTPEELQQTHTDEALSKSLWTLMLKELLKHTVKSPYTYMSGLLLLSELLPLPFPLHTKTPLTEKETETCTMARKLWSVHLQSSASELFAVLHTLSATGCQPLQHLMRRVCWQIADLAAPSSLRITKILLDILMVNLKPKKPTPSQEAGGAGGEGAKEGEEEMTSVRSVSIHTAKTLNLLAYLLSHPGIKAALLQLIGSSVHSEPKYKDFLPIMLQLLNQTAETPAEIQAQEGIVSMIQNLCDLEISMVNTDRPVTLAEHLANSLPESVLMSDVMGALLEHVGHPSQSYASILPCLRTLIMLTDHDYGFYHLKLNLEQNMTTMHSLLNRINNTFSKDSSDCLSTLSAVLELLRLLTSIDFTEDMAMTRTKVISRDDLRRILLWSPDVQHPLEELEELSKEEETLETILESITALTSLLRDISDTPQDGDSNLEEIRLPLPAVITDLFNQRAVFTTLDVEMERLSPSYWLANPAVDEPDAEPEVLRCDLQAICEQHLPDFNLEQELKKEATSVEENSIVKPRKLKGDKRKGQEGINIYRGNPGRKPFVAPMRGRGIMNHSLMGNRSNELFRTRIPNTSRPPSMHVDDFVKMEKNQQQQEHQGGSGSGGQGQSQSPLIRQPPPPMGHMGGGIPRDGRNKDHLHDRGGHGGFERAGFPPMPRQGQFFTPPGAYSRRDPMGHDPHPLAMVAQQHGAHRGGSMGSQMAPDRPRMNFMSSRPARPFSRGHDNGDRLGGRNDRFSPGGRGGGRGGWTRGRDMGEQSRFAGGFRGRRDLGRHMRSFTK